MKKMEILNEEELMEIEGGSWWQYAAARAAAGTIGGPVGAVVGGTIGTIVGAVKS